MTFPGSVEYVARSQEKEVARMLARHRYRPLLGYLAATAAAGSTSPADRLGSFSQRPAGGEGAAAAAAELERAMQLLHELQAALGVWEERQAEVGAVTPHASVYRHLITCALAAFKSYQAAAAFQPSAAAAAAASASSLAPLDDAFATAGLTSIPLLPTVTTHPIPHPLDCGAGSPSGYTPADTAAVVSFLETWMGDAGCSLEARRRVVVLLVEVASVYSAWLSVVPHPRMHETEVLALAREVTAAKRGGAPAAARAAAVAQALVQPGDGWAFWHTAKRAWRAAAAVQRAETVTAWGSRVHPSAAGWVAASQRVAAKALRVAGGCLFVVTAYARFVLAKVGALVLGTAAARAPAVVSRWDAAVIEAALDSHAARLTAEWRGSGGSASAVSGAAPGDEQAVAQVLAAVGLASPRFLQAYRSLEAAAVASALSGAPASHHPSSDEGSEGGEEEEEEGGEEEAASLTVPPELQDTVLQTLLPVGFSRGVVARLPQLLLWEAGEAASSQAAAAAQLPVLAQALLASCTPVTPPRWLEVTASRGQAGEAGVAPRDVAPASGGAASAAAAVLARSRRLALRAAAHAAALSASIRTGVVAPARVLAGLGARKASALLCPSRVPHPVAGLPFMRAQLLACHGGMPFRVTVARRGDGSGDSAGQGANPVPAPSTVPAWVSTVQRHAKTAWRRARSLTAVAWRWWMGNDLRTGSWALDCVYITGGSRAAGEAAPVASSSSGSTSAACACASTCPCASLGVHTRAATVAGASAAAVAARLVACPARPLVLLCNPNAGLWEFTSVSSKWLSVYSDALGCDIVAFNYRGYGRSSGSPSIAAVRQDAASVLQALRAAGLPASRPVIVHGESIGGSAAAALPGRACAAGLGVDVVVADRNFDRLAQTASELVSPAAGLALRCVTAWNSSNAAAWLKAWVGAASTSAAPPAPARLLCADPADGVIIWSSSLAVGLSQQLLSALKAASPSSAALAVGGLQQPSPYADDDADVTVAVTRGVAWGTRRAAAAWRVCAAWFRRGKRRVGRAYIPALAALPAAPAAAGRQLGVAAWNDGRRGARTAIRSSLRGALWLTRTTGAGWQRLSAALQVQAGPEAPAPVSNDSVSVIVAPEQRVSEAAEPLTPAVVTDRLAALLYFTVVRLLKAHAEEVKAAWAVARTAALATPHPSAGEAAAVSASSSTAAAWSSYQDDAIIARCVSEACAVHPRLEQAAAQGLGGPLAEAAGAAGSPPRRSADAASAAAAAKLAPGSCTSPRVSHDPEDPGSAPTTPSGGGTLRARRLTADSSNPAYLPAPLPATVVTLEGAAASSSSSSSSGMSRQPSMLTLGAAASDFVGITVTDAAAPTSASTSALYDGAGSRTPPRGAGLGSSSASSGHADAGIGYTSSDAEEDADQDDGGLLHRGVAGDAASGLPCEAVDSVPLWHPRDSEMARQVGVAVVAGSKAAAKVAVRAGAAAVGAAQRLQQSFTSAPAVPAQEAAAPAPPPLPVPCALCPAPAAAAAWGAAFSRSSEHAAAHAVLRRWGLDASTAVGTAAWVEAVSRLTGEEAPHGSDGGEEEEEGALGWGGPVLAPLPFPLAQLLGMCRALAMLEAVPEGGSGEDLRPATATSIASWEGARAARALPSAGAASSVAYQSPAVADSRAWLRKLRGTTTSVSGVLPSSAPPPAAPPRSPGLLALQALLSLSNGTGMTLGAALAARSASAAASGLGAVRGFVQMGLVYGWGGVPLLAAAGSGDGAEASGLETCRRRLLLLLRSGAAAAAGAASAYQLSVSLEELVASLSAADAVACSIGRLLRRAGAKVHRQGPAAAVPLALADAFGPAGKLVPLSCGHNNAWSEAETACIQELVAAALAASSAGAL